MAHSQTMYDQSQQPAQRTACAQMAEGCKLCRRTAASIKCTPAPHIRFFTHQTCTAERNRTPGQQHGSGAAPPLLACPAWQHTARTPEMGCADFPNGTAPPNRLAPKCYHETNPLQLLPWGHRQARGGPAEQHGRHQIQGRAHLPLHAECGDGADVGEGLAGRLVGPCKRLILLRRGSTKGWHCKLWSA